MYLRATHTRSCAGHPIFWTFIVVLFVELLYKSIWMIAVAFPLWSTYRSVDYTRDMVIGIVLDVVAIPWRYVWEVYVKENGDRWKGKPRVTEDVQPHMKAAV